MDAETYHSVLRLQKLPSGSIFALPAILDVHEEFARSLKIGGCIQLRNSFSLPVAKLSISSIFHPESVVEPRNWSDALNYSTDQFESSFEDVRAVFVGGKLYDYIPNRHHIFSHLIKTPADTLREIQLRGESKVVAFQTSNPLHMGHVRLMERVLRDTKGILLLLASSGSVKPDDAPFHFKVLCYEAALGTGPLRGYRDRIIFGLIPWKFKMTNAREELMQLIISKNFGATHFVLGGKPKTSEQLQQQIGVSVISYPKIINLPEDGSPSYTISGRKIRALLEAGEPLPTSLIDSQSSSILSNAHTPKHKQGFVILIFGLSGSGKTTMGVRLKQVIETKWFRKVSLIDGDEIRNTLSPDLGFSKPERIQHLVRMGYMAAEIAGHGGIALVTTMAPYRKGREYIRERARSQRSNFFCIYMNTTLAQCQARDLKGLYKTARKGTLNTLSGVTAPFEEVGTAEFDLVLDGIGGEQMIQANAMGIMDILVSRGFVAPQPDTLWKQKTEL